MKGRRFASATFLTATFLFGVLPAIAGPLIEAGDLALRHDVQRLADYGVITGPTSTWPLAWGPILEDLRNADVTDLPAAVADSLMRLRARARIETQTGQLGYELALGVAHEPARIRSFEDTPRGDIEVSAGAEWLGDWISIDLNVQGVDSSQDDASFRADNSMLGIVIGNWSISASTMERWWGPGWDGSLILSNNARPIPSLSVDRVFTDRFKTKWLSWLGPWDVNVTAGQLESDRVVPDARFLGIRFNFRPLPSLEIGLSRSAQWCGDGRPCGFDTLVDLLLGKDNRGGGGIEIDNEPGNQLAGVDFRWALQLFGQAVALYGQFIGEDEAGGFPSRYLGQVGGEWSGYLLERWSARVFGEFAGTSCQFYQSSEIYNCAYNHSIYRTGYRYRGSSIGHGADNDARLISTGIVLIDAGSVEWRGLLRYGALNRGGPPDIRNPLTPTRQDIVSLDLAHSRAFDFGVVEIGAGVEKLDDDASGSSSTDARMYLQWRHLF